jgi:hypothetical protein
MVESKPIADLMPNRYLDASRKYSREPSTLSRKGDVDEASQAKHKELMNHFLFREATKARETADKITTYAKKLGQMKELRKLGSGRTAVPRTDSGAAQSLQLRHRGEPLAARSQRATAREPRQFLTPLKTDENLDLPIDPALLDESRPNQNYRSIPFSELVQRLRRNEGYRPRSQGVNSVRAE